MSVPKDLLETFATAIRGKPIGTVHIQILLSYYAPPGLSPEEQASAEMRTRKLLLSMGANAELRELLQNTEAKAPGLPLDQWPKNLVAEFANGLDSLTDYAQLFDDVPVFAIRMRSVAGERNSKRIARQYGVNTWCLMLTDEGAAEATTNKGTITLRAGDVALIPPKTPFYFDRARDSAHWYHYLVYFFPRPHATQWLDWGDSREGLLLMHISDSERPRLEQIFQELIRLRDTSSPLRRELEFNLLEQLLLRCRAGIDLPRSTIDERIALAKTYIADHHTADLTIAELAAMTGLSRSRLSVLFHQQVGVTIFEWRDRQRMARAAQLLRDTSLSIKEVAAQVGYSDARYFCRIFRRHMGTTPTALRN